MEYNQVDAEKIVYLIKGHVDNYDNCRVGWACEEVLKQKQQNHYHNKISAKVIQDQRYIRERDNQWPNDWNILKNPNYKPEKEEKWNQRNPVLYDFIKISGGAIIGAIVTYLLKK